MKSKDIILLKKILVYCNQAEEASKMFDNDYETFVENSVFQKNFVKKILQFLGDNGAA